MIMKITVRNLRHLIREFLDGSPTSPKIRNALAPAEADREQISAMKLKDDEEIAPHLRQGEDAEESYEKKTVKRKENPPLFRNDPYTRDIT
jgi:hypothetical protein